MRVSRTERPDESHDEQRAPTRRAVLWGLIGVAVVVGVVLYFQYERVLAPLVSP
jgi:type VI protein secretion system component VasF